MELFKMLSQRVLSFLYLVLLYSHFVYPSGMVPESTVLFIDESEKGGSIAIKNTDENAALLYTKIIDLPDDNGINLLVTQPVIRVESEMTQNVHFILANNTALETEHMKRVIFEGIPPVNSSTHNIQINISQNLPVIIHPKSLPIVYDAWKLLRWHLVGNTLTVSNPSKYIVRLDNHIHLLPSEREGDIGKKYILPNQRINVKLNKTDVIDVSVIYSPASRQGFQVKDFTSILQ